MKGGCFRLEKTYAVIDLETTGPSFDQGDRIIQIGVVIIKNDEISKEVNLDIQPLIPVPPQITSLTGITNEQLEDAPIFPDIAEKLWRLLEDTVFVAHNVNFDFKFLKRSFQGAGFPSMTHPTLDTVELIRVLYPTASSYKLSEFAEAHDIELKNAHTAFDDALATAQILLQSKAKVVQLPASLIKQLELFCHFFIGQTGEIMLSWCDKDEQAQFNHHYTNKAPFTLVKSIKGSNVFPDKFGKHDAKSELIEGMDILTQNNGVTLRPSQREIVADILSFKQQESLQHAFLTAEAGSGKTLSYLVGTLSEGIADIGTGRTLIATPTLVLQYQLLEQSLQLLANLFGRPINYAQLKSSKHYIDLTQFAYFINYYQQDLSKMKKRDAMISMAVLVWLSETHTGDKAELNRGLMNDNFWQTISSLKKLSMSDSIERWGEYAFYAQQLQHSKTAEVVIVNYAFLFTHIKELLAEGVFDEQTMMVFDESHQLPEKILQATTYQVYSNELDQELHTFTDLLDQLNEALLESKYDNTIYDHLFNTEMQLQQLWSHYDELVDSMSDAFQNESYYKQSAKSSLFYVDNETFKQSTWRLKLMQFEQQLTKLLDNCSAFSRVIYSNTESTVFRQAWYRNQYYLKKFQMDISSIAISDPERYITIETRITSKSMQFVIIKQFYDAQTVLQQLWQKLPTKNLLVSASNEVYIATGQLSNRYGVSKFANYSYHNEDSDLTNKLLTSIVLEDYLSLDKLNERDAAKYTAEVIMQLWQSPIHKIQVVFHSHTLLNLTHTYLKRQLPSAQFEQIIAQTQLSSVAKMYQQFDRRQSSILLGLDSFNEGVHFDNGSDMLILTRLPFESPKSVRERAKQDWCQQQNINYFESKALPDMLIKLKQIFGRMMNQTTDRRYIVSLDKRLLTSSYRDAIKASLPPNMDFKKYLLAKLKEEVYDKSSNTE